MKAPEFKPLPSLGGSIEDRLERSETARKALIAATLESEREAKAKRDAEERLGKRRAELGINLTSEQIKNWRTMLFMQIGPYAFIMPETEIQAIRDGVQTISETDS